MSATETIQLQKQPDISYHPDFEKYKIRTERLKAERTHIISLPAGFPAQLEGPLLEEIHSALLHFKGLNKPIEFVNRETFPLPHLSQELRRQAQVLQNGRGFFVLRGLDVDRYNIEDNVIIYAGISSYIGSVRGRQDSKIIDGVRKSSMLNHIKDLSQTAVAGNIVAPAYTTDKQVFHTDAGDIVPLLCLNTAAQGGASKLASSWRVYNEIARTRPDLIMTLSENWVFDAYGNPDRPYTTRSLLHHTPAHGDVREHVIIQYARRGFTGFVHVPRSKDIPPITEAQAEALDALHFLAEKFSITLDSKRAMFNTRHLIRLWLRDPELAWETPAPLKERSEELYKDVTEEQVFPLEPRIRGGAGKA